MRKIILLTVILVFILSLKAQYTTIVNEKFNAIPASWTVNPIGSWTIDTLFSASVASSILGNFSNVIGDSIELITPWYDLTNYPYVYLQFDQICKMKTSNSCQIKYQELSVPGWKAIPSSSYKGKDPNAFKNARFNHESYTAWQAYDSLAIPSNNWWKEEFFDISGEASFMQVRFKFIITKENINDTQSTYGWLIDNFKIIASQNEVKFPIIEFLFPSPVDTVYDTGPFKIMAKIISQTTAPILQPIKLNVCYTYNNMTTYDTLLMTLAEGDSIYSTEIPQKTFGTNVLYSIEAKDSMQNDAITSFNFYIRRHYGGFTGYITIGNQAANNLYNILYYNYDYGWSQQLYLSTEINPTGAGGLIKKIAFFPNATWLITNQKCYFKIVNETTINITNYIDPLKDGATLVWADDYNITASIWNEITLTNPFMVPPGKNLMIYWENREGTSNNNISTNWAATNTLPYYRAAYKYSDLLFPITSGTLNYYRPDIRIYILGSPNDSNSVALHKINNPHDSVITAPGHQVPIIVSIKNKGIKDLDSCYINYTLNGVIQPKFVWRGNIPSDFNAIDTIGYYTPKLNNYDTIIVWVSNPNGQIDSTTNDDTLTAYIFGMPELAMNFLSHIPDTIYNTGPFTVKASILSHNNISIQLPVNMFVTYTYNGITSYDTITMQAVGNNQFEGIIPQYIFGTSVYYAINRKDALGNDILIDSQFFIKRIVTSATTGYVTIGKDTIKQETAPLYKYYDYSWSKIVFKSSELSTSSSGGLITKLAWQILSTCNNAANQYCYFKEIADTNSISNVYENPIVSGATLVWTDTLILTKSGWIEITLTKPFFLTPNKHLMVYWENYDGNYAFPYASFYATSTFPNYMTVTDYEDNIFPIYYSSFNGGFEYNRPNAQFFIIGSINDSNSVALLSIDSPTENILIAPNIDNIPIRVTIKNKGIAHLKSCNISWSLNGIFQSTKIWQGNLPEDFNDTITVGYYTPTARKNDKITIWVSLPNGKTDTITYDDTLTATIANNAAVTINLSGPQDTVFHTGPFKVNAKIISLTSQPIDTNIRLKIAYVYNNTTIYDTISMINTGNDTLWTAILKQSPFTSKVIYSLSVVDSLGSIIHVENNFYIQRPKAPDSIITPISPYIGGSFVVPFDCRYPASYSRVIYKNKELGDITSSIRIVSIAWQSLEDAGYAYNTVRNNQTVYCKEVDDTIITIANYIDPILDGATLVWSGSMTLSAVAGTWYTINLSKPFVLRPNKNLIIYYIDQHGIANSTFAWNYINESGASAFGYGTSLTNFFTQNLSSYKPFTRFKFHLVANDSNTAELTSILHPKKETAATVLTPVKVVITNKGIRQLDSCLINWSVNNQLKTSVIWKGNPSLFEQFSDTVLLGTYTPTPNKTDTIIAWVSMPNGIIDPIKDDDTLMLKVFGKAGIVAEFIPPLVKDTIHAIGPFEINARIQSFNSLPNLKPVLNVAYTYKNTTTYDTIVMTTIVFDSLYKTTIPQKPYDTRIEYSITLIDSIGTSFSISNWFYTKSNNIINDSNSAALFKIISPKDTAQCFQLIPIQIIIKNKGIKNLITCNIEWTKNGIFQTPYQWNGNLPEDFTDTITIGTYTPIFDTIDKFKIWTSLPNNQIDAINNDDTLRQNAYGYYLGGNIIAKSIVSPINTVDEICFPKKTALKVRLKNEGTKIVNFFDNPITFYIHITGAINQQIQKTISNGSIGFEEKEITIDSIDIHTPGTYNIKVHYYCSNDVIHSDDTLYTTYNVNMITFPYDNDFSIETNDYQVIKSNNIAWKINTNPSINPIYGTGALHIGYSAGDTSILTFYPINIKGAAFPIIAFWFAHNNKNPNAKDRILLKISKDGGHTFTTLQTIYRYDASATTLSWKNYTIDLLNYSTENCLIFALEAISEGGDDMWIDRLKIASNYEIGLTNLDIQTLDKLIACDLSNQSLSATITNNVNKDLDFSETPVTITIKVSGAVNQTYSKTINTGKITANSNHTVIIENNFDYSLGGTYHFNCYIKNIDSNPFNDTLPIKSITIIPDLSIDSIVSKECEIAGSNVYTTIFIKNTGNIKAHNIPLRLQIDEANDIVEIATITLNPNEKNTYTFTQPYVVPLNPTFNLSVTAALPCDINVNNNKKSINCCSIESFLKVISILSPVVDSCDLINTYKYASIVLYNAKKDYTREDDVYLIIDDKQGNITTLKEKVFYLDSGLVTLNFSKPYQIPNLEHETTYMLTSYVYSELYGLSIYPCVKTTTGINEQENKFWTINQNTPNPAQNYTIISYFIPTASEITFKLMTISGQNLYEKKIKSPAGLQELKLPIEKLENGIYYYYINYQGQRIIRKMVIQK